MIEERIKEIRLKLAVFDFGRLQELLTLFSVLEREELTLEDVREFIEAVKELQKAREATFNKFNKDRERLWNKGTRRCPTCAKPLMLRPINTPKGKANREGYTCHWFCLDEKCNFEEYTKEDFQEVYKKIMGGR
jgi:hypothetical protein